MKTEFEAKFLDIDVQEYREKIKSLGGKQVKKRFLQRRFVYDLPTGHKVEGGWVRVRDEGDKVTLAYKQVSGNNIEDQKEAQVSVSDFDEADAIIRLIGCVAYQYEENYRELWDLGGVEITIDEWPFLNPFTEIEADTEQKVIEASEKLGFDHAKSLFGQISAVYEHVYKIDFQKRTKNIDKLVFDMENPFV